MNTLLWIGQALLGVIFLLSGYAKGTWSVQKLAASGQTGALEVSLPVLRFIALTEILGAVGITVPWITGIAPVLTPLAAIGFAIIMVLAARVHYRRGEMKNVRNNMILLALSLFVAIGRLATL